MRAIAIEQKELRNKIVDALPLSTPIGQALNLVRRNPASAAVPRCAVYRPPYDFSFHTSMFWVFDGFGALVGEGGNVATGATYIVSDLMTSGGASDWDSVFLEQNAGFAIPHKVTQTGRLEITVKARNRRGDHICSLSDEFGFSDSHVIQTNYLKLEIRSPHATEEHLQFMSYWYEEGYRDGSWNMSYLSRNGTYYASWVSDGRYQKNEWIDVDVTNFIQHFTFGNDVMVDSQMYFDWDILEVSICSA
jgi:hypothetical protein